MSLSAPRRAPAAARPAPPPRSAAQRRAARTDTDPVAPALAPGRAGFVLYVSLPEDGSSPEGHATRGTITPADLAGVAELLREAALDLLPAAETYTALSLAPQRPGPSVEFGRFGERLSHLRLITPLPDGTEQQPLPDDVLDASATDVLGESGDTR
ncbi:hypothetical protein [Cellulomonas soli]|uniref:Uncharacterized protein n=1 Tax=Cellulomonas soli TaxID=931535 RepID=A0A512PE83_9CELL|nr:hypothetical protein [Cellulomonas soli]NYI58993.1 hypothetical protein [Cellulomonas soli]GEP69514.1 hypothetical protein CSO01_22290 [Cellulomonas soli]